MVFFNDPVRCDDGPLRAIRMAWRCAPGSAGWPRPGRGRGTTSRWASGSPRATRRSGKIGFDGRFDYAAIGSVTNLAARLCDDRRAVADPGHRAGVLRRRVARGRRGRRHARAARVQPRASVRSASRASTTHGPRHDRRPVDARPTRRRTCCRPCREEERYRRFDALQARMAEVWESMRLNHDDESVVVVPSITLDRAAASSGSLTQAIRGAVPVPADAAASAAAAHGLRDVDADRARDHRVLPGPAARRDPEPRPGPAVAGRGARLVAALAEREAAGPAAAAGQDRCADPQPGPLPPDPVQHHRARARRRSLAWASRCTAPTRGSHRSARRPGAVGCSPRSACRTRSGWRTCTRSTSWPTPSSPCAPSGRPWTASS